MDNPIIKWLPEYTIRHSQRAKYVKVHIDSRKGVVLVLPKNVSQRSGLRFLKSKRDWIEKHIHIINQSALAPAIIYPPDRICLKLLQREWQVVYRPVSATIQRNALAQKGDRLILSVFSDNLESTVRLLKLWLKRIAKQYLSQTMHNISNEIGLEYNRLSFRHQKTLWGSCSHNKNISLNVKLLFLPFKYVRYVMIHEMCHTLHMNHSKQFWRCVARYEPDYLRLDKEINRVQNTIPDWYDFNPAVQSDQLRGAKARCAAS
jgi:predicted metal-dependent hydrolase